MKTKYTESPIHIAIMLSHDGLVNTLLENGVNGNTPCGHAYPIHLAMQHESTQCAKKLIEHLPECLQLRDKKYGGMPIHWVKSSEVSRSSRHGTMDPLQSIHSHLRFCYMYFRSF